MCDLSSGGIPGGNPSRKTSEYSSLIQSGVVVLLGSFAVFAVARYNSVISFFRISALSRLREIIEIQGVSSCVFDEGEFDVIEDDNALFGVGY